MTTTELPLAERVRGSLSELTRSERRVAQTLLANYPLQGLETAAQFAGAAGVSTPSVLRFVARIGFASYASFQRRVMEEVEAQLQSPLAKTGPIQADVDAGPQPHQTFAKAIADNVLATFRHLPLDELDAVADILADARRPLHLLGGRFTDPVAYYMTAHLRILRPNVMHIAGQPDNWRDQLIDMSGRDALFLIDIRRYQNDLCDLAEAATKRRVTTIVLTDQWISPAARYARYTLPARVSVPSAWDSNAALLAVVEALIADVMTRRWRESRKRMAAIEGLRENADSDGAPTSVSSGAERRTRKS
ncbi:MAG: MurR/RpiR family transcriptional regulator [Hyphomicrobiales bacterium]|nr:MurR/RpiR family transcriptional regulator [Hyphomicrobiales bacterium]